MKIFTLLVFSLIMFGCQEQKEQTVHDDHEDHGGHEEPTGHDDHDDHNDEEGEHEEGGVEFTSSEVKEFGLVIDTVKSGSISITKSLLGEVQLNDSRVSHVSARFSGQVKKVYKQLGAYVKKGELLAEVESDESLQIYPVLAEASGRVISKHSVIGENVNAQTTLYTIAQLGKVWVMLDAFSRDLNDIRRGQKAWIIHPTTQIKTRGRINWVSPVMDAQKNVAHVRVELSNPKSIWTPGMKIKSQVEIKNQKVKMMVPKSAIHKEGDSWILFKAERHEEGDNQINWHFEELTVKLGLQGPEFVEVISGVESADLIVAQGSFFVKAEFSKSQFSDGHNH